MTSRTDPVVARKVLDGLTLSPRLYGLPPKGYIGPADTARLMRSALKLAFPGVTFAVRSKSYSGGSHVDVRWIDGPTKDAVHAALSGFVGHDFDGMIDMTFSSDCYIVPATGRVGFARTDGTVGSMGSVPAASAPVPDGAVVVTFLPSIFIDRDLSRKAIDDAVVTLRADYGPALAWSDVVPVLNANDSWYWNGFSIIRRYLAGVTLPPAPAGTPGV